MSEQPSNELERLCMDLLAIPSVIGDERKIADFVEGWVKKKGFHAVTRAGENLAFQPLPFREGVPRLLLLGHLDTVPVSDANPARVEGDLIHGLGSSDMKGGDAVLMQILARAVEEDPLYDLVGVLYAAEEGPYVGSGMPEIISAAPGAFQEVDLAIAMEPTDNQIELGCLGTMHATVTFEGQRAHSARPWQGRNALHMAAPLLSAISALEPRDIDFDGLHFREVLSVTMLDYDGARNVVPGKSSLNLNFRFGPDRSSEEAVDWLEIFVREAVGPRLWDQGFVRIEITDLCPSGKVCGDNPILIGLRQAAGSDVQTLAKQAWTDVGRLSQMGLDALNFGPGTPAQAHQVGEHLSRARLAASYAILSKLLYPSD